MEALSELFSSPCQIVLYMLSVTSDAVMQMKTGHAFEVSLVRAFNI